MDLGSGGWASKRGQTMAEGWTSGVRDGPRKGVYAQRVCTVRECVRLKGMYGQRCVRSKGVYG